MAVRLLYPRVADVHVYKVKLFTLPAMFTSVGVIEHLRKHSLKT